MEDDPKLNPGQNDIDRKTDFLKRAEENGTGGDDNNGNDDPSRKIKDNEENADGSWINNTSLKKGLLEYEQKRKLRRSGAYLRLAKKKGPLTAIILTLVGGGIGISGLLSPSLLIIHIKEIMTDKFNLQLTSMEIRNTQMLTKKMGTTSGVCGAKITIQCKYSTMSKKQIANFEKAGIKVNYDDVNLVGRAKPTSLEFEGKTITAKSEFSDAIKNNPQFRAALKDAYNPKFAGFADNIWKKAKNFLGITEAAKVTGVTDEEISKTIKEEVNNPNEAEKIPDSDTDNISDEKTDAANKAANEVDDIAESGTKSASEIADSLDRGVDLNFKGASLVAESAFKATGSLDAACTVYSGVNNVALAAKMVRSVQLAKYAMLFLNAGDQIKAGVAKPELISYLGKVLTATRNGKSATDSFGYKYAAYGDLGKMSTSASQYMVGGGLSGKLSTITKVINDRLGKNPDRTCGFLANPIISLGSFFVGIAMFFIPGVNVVWSAKQLAQVAAGVVFSVAAIYLPAMLKDIVAGILVDENTVAEDAGDALTSGSSVMMGDSAKFGGNAPMSPKEAVAYSNLTKSVIAQYDEEERLARNPFDISTDSTFLGKIVSNLIPYVTKMSSLSTAITSMTSLTTNSFAMATSTYTLAADSTAEYTMCQDYAYVKLGIATDPYCNVVYGIPTDSIDMDSIKIADKLVNFKSKAGDDVPLIDEETGDPIDRYASYFLPNCINRTIPLGTVDDENDIDDGSDCIFGERIMIRPAVYDSLTHKMIYPETNIDNKYFYLHYIDQRIESGMDGE